MYTIETSPVKTRPVQSRLALVAVTLCAALLVAALAVAMPFMRFYATPPNNPAMTGNQALPPAVNQPKAVYIANSSGILKLDPNTGNTLNSYPWPHKLVSAQPGYTVEPFTLQMGGKLLYAGLKVRNSSGHLIYGGVQAFDPSEGEMLWGFEGQTVQNAALTLANGIVYLSVDHPDIVGRSLVFAL
jgi:outer membrane protein assembly factor BamB